MTAVFRLRLPRFMVCLNSEWYCEDWWGGCIQIGIQNINGIGVFNLRLPKLMGWLYSSELGISKSYRMAIFRWRFSTFMQLLYSDWYHLGWWVVTFRDRKNTDRWNGYIHIEITYMEGVVSDWRVIDVNASLYYLLCYLYILKTSACIGFAGLGWGLFTNILLTGSRLGEFDHHGQLQQIWPQHTEVCINRNAPIAHRYDWQ